MAVSRTPAPPSPPLAPRPHPPMRPHPHAPLPPPSGELFDYLMETCDGLPPPDEALCWLVQLVGAVAHCHSHGAVHGQLHPENVLLVHETELQLTGFQCCDSPTGSSGGRLPHGPLPPSQAAGGGPIWSGAGSGSWAGSSSCGGSPSSSRAGSDDGHSSGSRSSGGEGEAGMVELRPLHALDAPELRGRKWASAGELYYCDIWSLGVLLVYLLTGRPDVQVARAKPPQSPSAKLRELPSAVGAMAIGDAGSTSAWSASSWTRPRDVACEAGPLFDLAAAMLQREPKDRPTADEVLIKLRQLAVAATATLPAETPAGKAAARGPASATSFGEALEQLPYEADVESAASSSPPRGDGTFMLQAAPSSSPAGAATSAFAPRGVA